MVLFVLVLLIVSQNVTKSLDSLGSGRNPLAFVNHNVPRCPPDAWENCSSAAKKARLAELTRVRVARHRQKKKEKEKAKESVIINSNVTRAASIEETIQPFAAVLENTEQSVPQEDVREAPIEMTAVDTSVSRSKNRCCLFRMSQHPRGAAVVHPSIPNDGARVHRHLNKGQLRRENEDIRNRPFSFLVPLLFFAFHPYITRSPSEVGRRSTSIGGSARGDFSSRFFHLNCRDD